MRIYTYVSKVGFCYFPEENVLDAVSNGGSGVDVNAVG